MSKKQRLTSSQLVAIGRLFALVNDTHITGVRSSADQTHLQSLMQRICDRGVSAVSYDFSPIEIKEVDYSGYGYHSSSDSGYPYLGVSPDMRSTRTAHFILHFAANSSLNIDFELTRFARFGGSETLGLVDGDGRGWAVCAITFRPSEDELRRRLGFFDCYPRGWKEGEVSVSIEMPSIPDRK
ncbi:MAG: hypothetical protein UY52_C0050G0003 [Parcubacteria group bacterium GW2011_GWC2_49_9]|nr:MAG: hypothetical protein UY52_C0050G0003 [Parcubacteria group bacterium GW2011_GWC2_49_9]